MPSDTLPEEWSIIRGWLPEDLNERAKRHGFFQRARGLTDAECWLRLVLMHVAGGLSLEQAAVRARELGLANVSGVALFKRLRNAEGWLRDLCQYVLAEQQARLTPRPWPSSYRLRIIDATDVQEPGSTGSTWRVHYSIRVPELVCDHYEVTDQGGGEKLGRFAFAPDELVLVDRGYSHRAGVAHVLNSGAAIVLRWNPAILPVNAISGQPFRLLTQVRRLPAKGARDWAVHFRYHDKSYPLRLCAIRKSRSATERARRKKLRKAKCRGLTADPQAIELTEYILVLTSLPETFAAADVLELYRSRWQIELTFKRLKSLLAAGHVPKTQDRSARAWMQAKLLTALLLDRLLLEAKAFSPWGYRLSDS